MADLDFFTFGAPRNREFLQKIEVVLDAIESDGGLYEHSAELYYGSKGASALIPYKDHPYIIGDGSCMLLDMPDSERTALFVDGKPSITPDVYVRKVEQWREAQDDRFQSGYTNDYLPVAVALKFLWFYYRARTRSDAVRNFFQCTGYKNHIQEALAVRDEIEARLDSSTVCATVVTLFREYETFTFQWEKTREHMALHRAIMKRQRKKFYEAVATRDGEYCAKC